ncbi:enoyl-CoA hydratase-related protein [Echinicola sediminis]
MKDTYKNISILKQAGIGTLRLNRPEQLNAMNREMMDEIIAGIEDINSDSSISVGVITGNGRAFMAGADIKEYGNQSPEQFKAFQIRGNDLYAGIEKAQKPWIAAVNGYALGGGFEIALACDLILAVKGAKLGLPEVFLSLIPGGGGTQRLIQKTGINRAKEMLFTGGQYDALTLKDWGIVNHIYEETNFQKEVESYAAKLARRPIQSLRELKRLAQLSLSPIPFEEKTEEEGKTVEALFHSESAQEAIRDFILKSSSK